MLSIASTALALLAPLLPAQDAGPPEVVAAELGSTLNVHRAGPLWFAGQFQPADLGALQEQGIRRVISLRQDGELDWDEQAAVEGAGLEFVSVPLKGPDTMTDEAYERVRALLAADAGPTLMHCASANRVGGVWIPYRVLDQGVPLETAVAEAKTIGLRTPGFVDRATAFVEGAERARRSAVPEGINKAFKDPELDVDDFVQRFETESREVYTARFDVLKVLAVQPGDRVADIGAGTGLYTHLLTEVADWVYAVDISPRFLEHIQETAEGLETDNLTTVLCPDDSTGLPPASIDLAWICDTYHHFEEPQATMGSVLRALRPGGRLVVLDFERIPGVSRPWLLEHVRAGKDVFRAEIEQAGFAFVRELEVPGIEENYVLEFRKPE